ncbi:hypothetical protein C8Q78DRAFT_1023634 [Trametes maxima]|nr:hypothetical protein C8Q78DRAFT_1023634 [Trametes maxima]
MMTTLGPEDGHVPGNMLAGLCSTSNTGEYHWVIYVCTVCFGPCVSRFSMFSKSSSPLHKTLENGYKFHAHNAMNTAVWRYHCGPWNALDSSACVALTKIGRLPQGKTWENVNDILKDIPMAVPEADRPVFGNRFTCLVWFRAAVRKLHAERYIGVTDIDQLEQSLRKHATAMEYRRLWGLDGSDPKPTIMAPSDYTY